MYVQLTVYILVMLITIDEDYIAGPYNVKIPAGMKYIDFNITINGDKILEVNESFTLTIDPSSLPNNVSIGDQDTTTVTIVDDDGKYPITIKLETLVLLNFGET